MPIQTVKYYFLITRSENCKIMRFCYFPALNRKSEYTEHFVSTVSAEGRRLVWEESHPASHSFDHLTYRALLSLSHIPSHLTRHPLKMQVMLFLVVLDPWGV